MKKFVQIILLAMVFCLPYLQGECLKASQSGFSTTEQAERSGYERAVNESARDIPVAYDVDVVVVGGGVAIPHAFVAEVEKPIIGALYLKRAVPFCADGDGKVKTVFYLIGNESKPQNHISILARIARLCSTPEFLDAFAGARTNRDLYKTILKWDKRVGSV